MSDCVRAGEPKVWYYTVHTDPGDWHIVVLTQEKSGEGSFFTNGSYGSYAFSWFHTGYEDFREFFIRCDISYIYSKITHEQSVYDSEATLKCARETINSQLMNDPTVLDTELALLEEHEDLSDEHAFARWQAETTLYDVWEIYHTKSEPQCATFCKEFIPKLKEYIKLTMQHCDQCGTERGTSWPIDENRCPNHANPLGSCDGILK